MGMLENEVELNLDGLEDIDNMEVYEICISKNEQDPAVLIMIQNTYPEIISHVVRLYSLVRKPKEFIISDEIEAFGFMDRESAVKFANRLPQMSAFEILMIMGHNTDAGGNLVQ